MLRYRLKIVHCMPLSYHIDQLAPMLDSKPIGNICSFLCAANHQNLACQRWHTYKYDYAEYSACHKLHMRMDALTHNNAVRPPAETTWKEAQELKKSPFIRHLLQFEDSPFDDSFVDTVRGSNRCISCASCSPNLAFFGTDQFMN